MAARLPIAEEAARHAKAIEDDRRLLATPDPVPTLSQQVASALRAELVKAHANCLACYEERLNALAAEPSWKKLGDEQRAAIRDNNKIRPIDDLTVGTEDEVRASLNTRTIDGWLELAQAIPERFKQAALDALKASEPKAVRFTVPTATIKTEAELDAWLSDVRAAVVPKLKNGPVIF